MSNTQDMSVFRGRALANRLQKPIAGSGGAVLSVAEALYGMIEFTGVLTGNSVVVFPAADGLFWQVHNNTTGEFSLTAKVGSATGLVIPQGRRVWVYGDGTDLRECAGRNGSGVPTLLVIAGDVTLTTAQAAGDYLYLGDGSPSVGFTVTYPSYALTLGARVVVENATGQAATVKLLGTGDTGRVVAAGAFACLWLTTAGTKGSTLT